MRASGASASPLVWGGFGAAAMLTLAELMAASRPFSPRPDGALEWLALGCVLLSSTVPPCVLLTGLAAWSWRRLGPRSLPGAESLAAQLWGKLAFTLAFAGAGVGLAHTCHWFLTHTHDPELAAAGLTLASAGVVVAAWWCGHALLELLARRRPPALLGPGGAGAWLWLFPVLFLAAYLLIFSGLDRDSGLWPLLLGLGAAVAGGGAAWRVGVLAGGGAGRPGGRTAALLASLWLGGLGALVGQPDTLRVVAEKGRLVAPFVLAGSDLAQWLADGDGAGEALDGKQPEWTPLRPSFVERSPLAEATENLVLVTVDALRADRLGATRGSRPLTPNLDRLAKRGWVFERAYSPATTTRYALPALFQGRAASSVRWREGEDGWLRPRSGAFTLAQLLQKAGVRTAAVVPPYAAFLSGGGLDAGFDLFDSSSVRLSSAGRVTEEETSVATTAAALVTLQRLRAGAGPWFLWVHYLDPHSPHRNHADVPHFGEAMPDRYDAEVAHTDLHLGRLLDALAEGPDADRTGVMVTADHGEQLGERGMMGGHGYGVGEEESRIPLIVALPGGQARRVMGPVVSSDITPTVLNLFEVRASQAWTELEGQSLLALAQLPVDAPGPPRFVEAWTSNQYKARRVAVHQGRFKAIRNLRRGTTSIYDLSRDPRQLKELGRRTEPARRAELTGLLDSWLLAHPLPQRSGH